MPCHGGGVYLYEVNATAVGLAGAGCAARADDTTTKARGVLEEKVAINNPEPSLDDGLLTLDYNDSSVQLDLGLLFERSSLVSGCKANG